LRYLESETVTRKSNKGYYIKGEFIAAGSDADRQIRDKLQDSNLRSRTALKKASETLQDLGEELLATREDLLAELRLPEALKTALLNANEMTSFGAKRRQMKYIGKLMRGLDTETLDAIRAAMHREQGQSTKNTEVLHRAEKWRDSLIAEDDRLAQWIEGFPGCDVQQLRSLIRQARKDAQSEKPGAMQCQGRAYRQIFSIVRSSLSSSTQQVDGSD